MNRAEIQALLPTVFQQTIDNDDNEETLLSALLDIIHKLHSDISEQHETVESFFNPCRIQQEKFIEYLAYWTDLNRLWKPIPDSNNHNYIDINCWQELIASAAYLSQWRGTKKGLSKFLCIATGSNSISITEGITKKGKPKAFHFLVQIPIKLKHKYNLIKIIIEQEKPAYISYEIKVIDK